VIISLSAHKPASDLNHIVKNMVRLMTGDTSVYGKKRDRHCHSISADYIMAHANRSNMYVAFVGANRTTVMHSLIVENGVIVNDMVSNKEIIQNEDGEYVYRMHKPSGKSDDFTIVAIFKCSDFIALKDNFARFSSLFPHIKRYSPQEIFG
jgi:hypothetical protein